MALLLGISSLALLIHYYLIEKDFRQNYKSVSTQFNHLKNGQERLNYGILQSTLFAYYNQDDIAKDRRNIKLAARQLSQHPLLKKKHYQPLKKSSDQLQQEIISYIEQIEYFLMLNGGIKNSSVFLTTHESQVYNFFTSDSEITKTIHMVINSFLQAKRLLDSDYLKQLTESVNKIKNASYNKNQQAYIDTLLIHVNFLNENYPLYIKVFSEIMNSPLRINLETTQQQFDILAEDDFTYLNTLAISLFMLIFLALIAISILLFYLKRDNKKLLILHNKLNFTLQHDALTGLLNRNSYDSFVSQQQQPIILLINISKFKRINDFYGAENADKFLIAFSKKLVQQFKDHSASCFRISGDEFTVVFTEKNQTKEDIILIAQKLNKHLTEKSYCIANIDHTISINIAISDQKPLLETADMVLKQIKLKPSVNILHYSKQYNIKEQIRNNIEMTQILHDALNDNRIIPYYQPIIDLKTREIVKYEALVRLKLNDGSILPPIKFLPIAQKTLLYYEITRIMISKTITYFADKPYRFSINFSMADFENDEIINILLGQFSAYPEVATRLDIEILESEKLTDMNRVKHFISELKKLGCGISIDDFGSGYSNFTNLTELDLDIIKIDGSLIKGIRQSAEHYKTVKAIMGLVNEMGIESIAEFVQDEASAQLLYEMGVTHAQGYFFGKPDAKVVEL